MNKTKLTKILITVLCFALVISASLTVFAATIGSVDVTPSNPTDTSIETVGQKVIGIIQVIGIIISVAALMILGIKYMMGSAEEKAEYKKTFIPYIIGAVILFAASALAKSIYGLATGIQV
jgi:type IV secretory pathway VirB2 component (pilin)